MDTFPLCLTVCVLLLTTKTSQVRVNDICDQLKSYRGLGLKDDTPADEYHPCGDGFCRCSEITADCSKHYGKLTYVPRLPPGILTLDFSCNGITNISRSDFFQNVTSIQYILLAGEGYLTYIHPEAFWPLKELFVLNLDGSNLNYSTLKPVFNISTLKFLSARYCNLGPPPVDVFFSYDLRHLGTLVLASNHIHPINLTVFSSLVNLRILQLHINEIGHGLSTGYLPRLEELYLHSNALFDFPITCAADGTSLFPSLRYLDLWYNQLQFIKGNVCLPMLNYLDLSLNQFLNLSTGMFSQSRFPSLEILEVSSDVGPQTMQKNALNNPSLRQLTLSFDNPDTIENSSDSYAGCTNLVALQVSGMTVYFPWGNFRERTFLQLFGHLRHLKSLDLSYCFVSEIHPRVFSNFHSLENFSLANNKIMTVPSGAFNALTSLKRLNLAGNKISVIKESTFSRAFRQSLVSLDISGNPFECSCDLLWFHQWLTSNPQLFGNLLDYVCENVPDTSVASVLLTDQQCLLSQEESTFVIIIFFLLMVGLTMSTLLFRYRWHIRLFLYEAFRGRGDRWRRLREQHFEYDVFVSYDKKDLHWVFAHLIPELEGRLGLRLCVHERDFIAGENIVDNIAGCVQQSKKVMMLFSKSFTQSQWCQFELNYCLNHVMHNDDMPLVVLLHDIPSRDLTPAMMAVMKTTTYIEWADEPEAQASFWGRMRIALNEILPAV